VPADAEDAVHLEDLKVELGAEVLERGLGRVLSLVERRVDGRERAVRRDGVEPCF
jgi:hypothetical protein